ncbi:hypothetical protein [Dongshaea marina]|uniref:hypothetical protein n=1 Tax=Dongshaea marina TaxID=2047966 RepID=UPI000D3E31B4|nr:hypothetical protein [Dongshaea marina]
MSESRYVFMIKDSVTLAQSLDDDDAGIVLVSLLRQDFIISPYQVKAMSEEEALSMMECHKDIKNNGYPWG